MAKLCWNMQADNLHVMTPELDASAQTKREVVSAAVKIYDTMGWFDPVTSAVKLLMQ